MLSSKKICLAIVLYQCPEHESETMRCVQMHRSLIEKNFSILVFDNTPMLTPQEQVAWYGSKITNGANCGLAYCYNLAINRCKIGKVEYLALLDQDTTLGEEYLNELQQKAESSVDVILPRVISSATGKLISPLKKQFFLTKEFPNSTLPRLDYRQSINSGTAVKISLIHDFGGYDERFWLDGLDRWFDIVCYRRGVYWVQMESFVHHSLSSDESVSEFRFSNIVQSELLLWQEFYDLYLKVAYVLTVVKRLTSTNPAMRRVVFKKLTKWYRD
jgi:GT2 family glycosyltransferase